jgi:Xaa-Pro aminopeptidase
VRVFSADRGTAASDAALLTESLPPYFAPEEFAARLSATRGRMHAQGLEALLVSAPENIFYFTGLDHWGYFAPHILIVPASGEMLLVTRAMERVTIVDQVRNARFEGHADNETAADVAGRLLHDYGLAGGRIGIEAWSSGMPVGSAERLKSICSNATWIDITGVVDEQRLIKSPAELSFMREAARVSDAAMLAALDAIAVGSSERDVAAACQSAMIRTGGTYPGFGPFIRSTARLNEEHTTWSSARLAKGDTVFLELSGCVARYHAPLGRLAHIGNAPAGAQAIATIVADAFDAVCGALKPGALFRNVYSAWQSVVDKAGLAHYQRHHCGYAVGIGIPPSWTGGNKVTGLRHDSQIVVAAGMAFHIISWLMDTGRGDFFASNTVVVGDSGAVVLTHAPAGIIVK